MSLFVLKVLELCMGDRRLWGEILYLVYDIEYALFMRIFVIFMFIYLVFLFFLFIIYFIRGRLCLCVSLNTLVILDGMIFCRRCVWKIGWIFLLIYFVELNWCFVLLVLVVVGFFDFFSISIFSISNDSSEFVV